MNTTYGVLNNSSLIIDTDKLRENVRTILRSLPAGTKLIPVVKDDAYGMGMVGVARTLSAFPEIGCFADGTVTAVGESSSYGKYITVAHEGGYSTLYAHCSRITVTSGTSVKEGEKIAEVGETGVATGPHLHFEITENGQLVNPLKYLTDYVKAWN